MKKTIFLLFLLAIAGCGNELEYDSCLQALEVISEIELHNGDVEYDVIGEVRGFSKGAYDLETALEETLNLDKKTLNGCLVFEENFPECFGYFIFDTRASQNISKIEFHQKAKVKLRRIKLKTPILESFRKQKNVEYLYLVKEVQSFQ